MANNELLRNIVTAKSVSERIHYNMSCSGQSENFNDWEAYSAGVIASLRKGFENLTVMDFANLSDEDFYALSVLGIDCRVECETTSIGNEDVLVMENLPLWFVRILPDNFPVRAIPALGNIMLDGEKRYPKFKYMSRGELPINNLKEMNSLTFSVRFTFAGEAMKRDIEKTYCEVPVDYDNMTFVDILELAYDDFAQFAIHEVFTTDLDDSEDGDSLLNIDRYAQLREAMRRHRDAIIEKTSGFKNPIDMFERLHAGESERLMRIGFRFLNNNAWTNLWAYDEKRPKRILREMPGWAAWLMPDNTNLSFLTWADEQQTQVEISEIRRWGNYSSSAGEELEFNAPIPLERFNNVRCEALAIDTTLEAAVVDTTLPLGLHFVVWCNELV